MTSDRPNSEDQITSAIARAVRALPASDPQAQVFFEDRWDSRLTLSSSGDRDLMVTRTRGSSIDGRSSRHATEPDFLVSHRHDDWVAGLEAAIVKGGTDAGAGRRYPSWSSRLVTFHQKVWVGRRNDSPIHDIRVGCRLELRAEVGVGPAANAVQELVLRPEDSPPIKGAFERAFERAEARVSISSSPDRGPTTAVLAPGVGGIVAHELIGHALEGDVVARGSTWVHGNGSCSARSPLTVVDDPRRGRGAWRIDDQGVSAEETILLEGGRPVGMLLDRASALALGRVSTGHGRRASYLDAVRPRMGCTFIDSGTDDPEEILRSTRSGVFIRRMIGGHNDPITGRATFIVSDSDRIVDGHLAEPLDAFVMELDGPKSWTSIDRVAFDLAFDTCVGSCVRDGQPMAVSVGAPTIRIGVVRVSS